MKENNSLLGKRDKVADELLDVMSNEGLTHKGMAVDAENLTKVLIFEYKKVIFEVSVRKSVNRYPVMIVGTYGEILFKEIPQGMSKTVEGIRVGIKGKSYPKTIDHALDQVRFLKSEIDKRV